jgi:hypothetical protein
MEGSCGHGNELSGSINCGQFLDWLSEKLCFKELVIANDACD